MTIEYEIANHPEDHGDGKGFKYILKGYDPALPAEHNAGSAHGKGAPLYITGTWTTWAERDLLLKAAMDKVPVITAAVAEVKDGEGNVTTPASPEILGKSPRQKVEAWIAKQIALPAVTKATLPTKDATRTVTETDKKGKETSREVTEKVTDRKVSI